MLFFGIISKFTFFMFVIDEMVGSLFFFYGSVKFLCKWISSVDLRMSFFTNDSNLDSERS